MGDSEDIIVVDDDDAPFDFDATRAAAGAHWAALVPDRVRGFTIVDKTRPLGEGGMGVVYVAEQEAPRRRVALKLVRPDLATPKVLRRFEFEAEVLGRLDHPGIARVLEAGVVETPLGRQPFFALELVEGQPLDRYLAEANLTRDERLRLLVKVARAVEHAHLKGVVHRDLKPSNVLVTAAGEPKVLDFGVARVVGADAALLWGETQHTRTGALVGTPAYMSPEQASGRSRDVEAPSDVYALGVIAYEALLGRLPYAVANRPFHEVVRTICESAPERLSSVDRGLRGHDAETVVLKALEKDPARRYATAGAFADDLQRVLDRQPVAARPASALYRTRVFARRNKALVGGVAATIAVLALGLAGTSYGFVREAAQRRLAEAQTALAETRRSEAERSAAEARAVTAFMNENVFARATPESIPDVAVRDTIVKVMLDPAARAVREGFADQPRVRAEVTREIACALATLGRDAEAEPLHRAALAGYRAALGPDHLDTLVAVNNLAVNLDVQGRGAEAEPLYRAALEGYARTVGPDDFERLAATNNLAAALVGLGRGAEAEPLYRAALEGHRRLLGPDHPETLWTVNGLAYTLVALGRAAEAEPLHRHALDVRTRALGPDHPDTLTSANNLALALVELGRAAEAEPMYRALLERCRRVLGSDHPSTLTSVNNLGRALGTLGRHDEAEPVLREALDGQRRVLRPDHPNALTTAFNLAVVTERLGRPADAEPLHRAALEGRRRALGPDHPATLASTGALAGVLNVQGRAGEAEPLYRAALDARRRALGADHPDALLSATDLARALVALGRAAEAEPLLRATLDARRRAVGADHPLALATQADLAKALLALGRAAEAEPVAREAVDAARVRPDLGPRDDAFLHLAQTHARCLDALGRPDEAAALRARFGLPRFIGPPAPSAVATRPD